MVSPKSKYTQYWRGAKHKGPRSVVLSFVWTRPRQYENIHTQTQNHIIYIQMHPLTQTHTHTLTNTFRLRCTAVQPGSGARAVE